VADNVTGWEQALMEIAASSASLEKLEERADADNPPVLEAVRVAHGRLLSVLTNADAFRDPAPTTIRAGGDSADGRTRTGRTG
jgi:hypothetical protein